MFIKINLEKAFNSYKEWQKAKSYSHDDHDENEAKTFEAYEGSIGKIKTVLDDVQKKCSVRTISVDDIMYWIDMIEDDLNIPKTHLKDVVAHVMDGAQKFPNSYKYVPEGTGFSIKHNGKSWYLIEVDRENCNYSKRVSMFLPEEAKKALIERHTNW